MEDNYTYDQAALSRSEADLNADVHDPEPKYDQPPLSRIEYLLQQIAGGVSSGIHLRGVVSSDEGLPETAENGDMYFIGPDANGAYREVVWLSSKEDWEELGYNAIDVDAFVKKDGDVMTGPLYTPDSGGQSKFIQFLHIGDWQAYQSAIETYLASDRGETAVAEFLQAIDNGTTAVISKGYTGVGFQMHWHGTGPSWSIPSELYYNLSDNDYTAILDDAVSIRKRKVAYTDETGYVPYISKGEVADRSELPSNPENGWTYIYTGSTLPSGEHGKLTYSSKLGTWVFTSQWDSYTHYKTIGMQMTYADVGSQDTVASNYIELDAAGLLRDDTYVPKGYVDAKVSSEFESNLLSYIDDHTITQAAYDALTDKTGFWFIKEATT